MTIITADDEPLALEMLTDLVKTVKPEAEVIGFSRPQKIVEWIKTNKAVVAFLEIRMRGMTGLELAEEIKNGLEIKPTKGVQAGFRLAAKDGSGYFDCSDDEIMQMLMPYFRNLDF